MLSSVLERYQSMISRLLTAYFLTFLIRLEEEDKCQSEGSSVVHLYIKTPSDHYSRRTSHMSLFQGIPKPQLDQERIVFKLPARDERHVVDVIYNYIVDCMRNATIPV